MRPDAAGCVAIQGLWASLANAGVPSIAIHRKGANAPHLSLAVAAHLDVEEIRERLSAAAVLPSPTIQFEAAGVFPEGVLFVGAVPDERLLEVQAVAFDACAAAPSTRGTWPHYSPGTWTPHITLGYSLKPTEVGRAMEVLLPSLPLALTGWTAWVEDGETGDAWILR